MNELLRNVSKLLYASLEVLVQLVWQDPKMLGWSRHKSYIFRIEVRPSLGRVRLKLQLGQQVLADSGYIYETSITGGKLGVYTHGQGNVVWSRLQAKCLQRANLAMRFNGNTSCARLPTLRDMEIISSFTLFAWVKLHRDMTMEMSPVICTIDTSVCLYIKQRKMGTKIGPVRVETTLVLDADKWHHLAMQYNAQDREMTLYVNGIERAANKHMPQSDLDVNQNFFLGCYGSIFKYVTVYGFRGDIDEAVFWNVYLEGNEIKNYIKLAGLPWHVHQRMITAYYAMNFEPAPSSSTDSLIVADSSEYNNFGNATAVKFVEVGNVNDHWRYGC